MRAAFSHMLSYAVGLAVLALALLSVEPVKAVFELAVPEPVLAVIVLVLLFGLLGHVPAPVRRISAVLLPHMALFFIPALVGLLALSDMLSHIIAPLALIIIVSTLLPLWLTAWLFQKFAPALEAQEERTHADE